MIAANSHIRVPEHVLYRAVGDDAVLLNLDTGQYYGLDTVGARMWDRLTFHGRVEPALADLLAEYNVEEERLLADLTDLVDRLSAAGLLNVDDQP